MKWLCRWVEYYLALGEDEAPRWVQRHVGRCANCQRQLRAYQQLGALVRRYGQGIPEVPEGGWKPLPLADAPRQARRVRPILLVPASAVLAALIAAAMVVNQPPHSKRSENSHALVAPAPATVAQQKAEDAPRLEAKPTPSIASAKSATQERRQTSQRWQTASVVASPTTKSAPQPSPRPTASGVQPPEGTPSVDVASKDASNVQENTPHNPPEMAPPVQSVWVEARPPASVPYPDVLIMQSAQPAAAGGVE